MAPVRSSRTWCKALALTLSLALCLLAVPQGGLANSTASDEHQQAKLSAMMAISTMEHMTEGVDYSADEILVQRQGEHYPEAEQVECGEDVEQALLDAAAEEDVLLVQPNYRYSLLDTGTSLQSLSNDPLEASQYHLDAWDSSFTTSCGANVEAAWELVGAGNSVTVAVLDTGVQPNHEDLQGVIDLKHMASFNSSTTLTTGRISDPIGHGTHVAGIIAATANNGVGVAGVGKTARILPIQIFYRVVEDGVAGYTSDTLTLITAYKYLESLVKSGELRDLHVVNLSLGQYGAPTAEDYALRTAITTLRNNYNVLTVCSGGNGDANDNPKTDPLYPADFDECLAVTALDKDGTNAKWSDYNKSKDISAPGVDILSTFTNAYASNAKPSELYQKGDASSYGVMSGTSMAAPVVSGVASLLWAAKPSLSVNDVVTAIKSTAHPVNPARNYRSSSVNGSTGAIDAASAVQWALSHKPSSTKPSKPTIKTLKAAEKGFSVTWSKSSNAAGYQFSYRLAGKSAWKTTTIKSATAKGLKASSLKPKKKYQVRVRAFGYNSAGKIVYSSWSSTKTVKTK